MSRTLSKILVICALVVLLPLTIVGTAFAAYYSVDAVINITILISGDKAAEGSNAVAGVKYNGELVTRNDFQISQSHLDTFTLEASSVGYDFVGWYEGETYTDDMRGQVAEGAEGNKLTAKMENGKSYIAVFEVIKYTASWNYVTDPDENMGQKTETKDPTDPEKTETTLIYGQELKPLDTAKATKYNANGWCLYDGEDAISTSHYTRAEFKDANGNDLAVGARNVTLTYDWVAKEMLTVNYYKYEDRNNHDKAAIVTDRFAKSDEIAKSYVYETRFKTLLQDKGVNVDEKLEKGYTWGEFNRYINDSFQSIVDNNFSAQDFAEVSSVDVFVKSEAVTYTATISETKGATYQGQSVEFTINDVANGSKFSSFFNEENYKKDYAFYELSGIKVAQGELIPSIEAEALTTALNALIDANKHETATLNFNAEFETEYQIRIDGNNVIEYKCLNGFVMGDVYHENSNLFGKQTNNYVLGTTTLRDFFVLTNDTTVYDSEHNALVFKKIRIAGVDIEGLTLDSTANDLIAAMMNNPELTQQYEINKAENQISIKNFGAAVQVLFEKAE